MRIEFSSGLCVLLLLASIVPAAPAVAPADAAVAVLDTAGFWRLHQRLAPPVIEHADGAKPLLLGVRWLDGPTPAAPAGWTAADFDDSGWIRGTARRAGWTAYLANLSLRGKFTVTDPAAVEGLTLSLDYHGGAVVYVNGREVYRGYLPAGAIDENTLAEAYPVKAFQSAEGKPLSHDVLKNAPAAQRTALRAMRVRRAEAIAIPASMLQKGVNVVAVRIVRAPYPQVVLAGAGEKVSAINCHLPWNTCELRRVQVRASSSAGLVPNAVRPTGLQVWASDLLAGDYDLDFGDPTEAAASIRLAGARNGVFSGKVVVGSTDPIRNLAAVATDLVGPGGRIPASAVQIRYGLPWEGESLYDPYGGRFRPSPYPAAATKLGGLAFESPATIPVRAVGKPGRGDLLTPGQPAPRAGAVAPVWVTVTTPADLPAGTYSGALTIQAHGAAPIRVPVEIKVLDWTLPDTGKFRTWVELTQLPDTTAIEYGLDLWSDRHFEMIGRSLDLAGAVGSRVVYAPLIAETNLGNAESMVRWVDAGDGTYTYDFSVFDRYLDLVVERMGEPKFVVFNAWEIYLLKQEKFKPSATMRKTSIDARRSFQGKGPLVTVVDAATGATKNVHLPLYGDPASEALWRSLFEQLRKRMAARGLEGAMALGILSDVMPTQEEVEFLTEVSGGLPWVVHQHHGLPPRADYRLHDVARIAYQTRVWNISFASGAAPGAYGRGWAKPWLLADYERTRDINQHPATKWLHLAEYNITGDQRGVGRIGADNWRAVKDKRGRRRGTAAGRYPHADWRNLNLYSALLAPGPDGPVATQRYEAFREGVQACEARIVIEEALTDKALRAKLPTALIARCEALLEARTLAMWRGMSPLQLTGPRYKRAGSWRSRPGVAGHLWFLGSSWRLRCEQLYAAAGEVSRVLAGVE